MRNVVTKTQVALIGFERSPALFVHVMSGIYTVSANDDSSWLPHGATCRSVVALSKSMLSILAMATVEPIEPPMNVFDIFIQYHDGLANGLIETLRLASIVWLSGLALGTLLGALGARYPKVFGNFFASVAFVLSGVPIIVFLFWLHYPLQAIFNVVIDPFITAALTLSTINIFAVSEVVRRVLRDFPEQYMIAAQVCGMGKLRTLTRIQLPLVFRQALPGLLTTQVTMLQCTLFASLISVNEIFRTAQRINSQIYRPVEIYTSLGILFLIVCLPLNGVALWLRNKYTRDLSER